MGSHLGQRMLPAFCAMLLFYWCLYFQAVKNQSQTELVDEEAMSQIRKGHETMCVVLTSRHKNLDAVRAVWSTSDIKASMGGVPEAREGSSWAALFASLGLLLLHTKHRVSQLLSTGLHHRMLQLNGHKETQRKLSHERVLFPSKLHVSSTLFWKSSTRY